MKITLPLTDSVLRALKALRLYSAMNGNSQRFKLGDELWLDSRAVVEPYVTFGAGRQLFSMGSFSYSWSVLDALQQVGRYCSIAVNVSNFSIKHRMDDVSTSPFSPLASDVFQQAVFDRLGTVTESYPVLPYDSGPAVPARIGHDVWIGEGALLARNITIGHGAVIGARSIVTKDVPPYAVVAGSPARLIRYRFKEDLVDQLLASQWWQYHFADFHHLSFREPERFVAQLVEASAKGTLKAYENDARPFALRLRDQLVAQGDAPKQLLDELDKRLARTQLQQTFEVPQTCPQWYDAEVDTRDGTLMRFFAHHAWLDVALTPDTAAIEFVVHFGVTKRAVQDLRASVRGVSLQREDGGLDPLGRQRWRFRLPHTGMSGATRVDLHCAVSTRPRLLVASRQDARILSVAVSLPRLVPVGLERSQPGQEAVAQREGSPAMAD